MIKFDDFRVKVLVTIGCLILFLGCKPRVNLGNSPGNKPEEEVEVPNVVEDAEVSFSMTFMDLDSNLRSYPSSDETRKARLSFNGVRIVLYNIDATTNQPTTVAYAFDFDINANKGILSGTDIVADSATSVDGNVQIRGSKKIKVGDYHAYFFATPSRNLKEVTSVGMTFTELLKPYNISDLFKPDQLKVNMYSSKEPIIISSSELREFGSAQVFSVSGAQLTSDNALVSVTYEPIVQNPQFGMYKKMIILRGDVMNRKVLFQPKMNQALAALELAYPEDANFTGFAKNTRGILESEFLYLKDTYTIAEKEKNSYARISSIDSSREGIDFFLVIPENTMAAGETNGNVVTRIIVQSYILPKHMLPALDNITELYPKAASELSWVLFKGKGYSEDEFTKLYTDARAIPSTKRSVTHNEVIKAGESLILYATPKSKTPDYSKMIYPETGMQNNLLCYYKYGENYFSIPVVHYKSTELLNDPNLPGRYGVVRNHHYNIHITSFGSYGSPTIGGLSRDTDYTGEFTIRPIGLNFDDFTTIESEIEL